MQDSNMQPAFQPYVKLVKSNMELLGEYSRSPEAVSRSVTDAQSLLRPGQASPSSLTRSSALTALVRGLIKNHTEFAAEVGERGIALLAHGQAALLQQTEQATHMVRGAAGGRPSGSR
jgi:hypothetical protein